MIGPSGVKDAYWKSGYVLGAVCLGLEIWPHLTDRLVLLQGARKAARSYIPLLSSSSGVPSRMFVSHTTLCLHFIILFYELSRELVMMEEISMPLGARLFCRLEYTG